MKVRVFISYCKWCMALDILPSWTGAKKYNSCVKSLRRSMRKDWILDAELGVSHK